jgi:sigma-B regulation protein RsbU (phosphoserine phosphatase)
MQPGATSPRVLIVDDDPAVLRAFARMLRDYAPLQARDGLEALDILSRMQVDVVLCDLKMPRMSGLDLMRWAKEHCPHPLWVVVTGRGTFDAAKQALKLGAFDFISKPVLAALQLQNLVANAARHQTLVAERARLMRSLADINTRLIEDHRSLEAINARLHEQQAAQDQDLQRAERLLRALLPRALRPIDGMHVHVVHRPSRSIGGDFYGAAMVDAHHLTVFVADAAGHGVSAALLAVLFNQRVCVCNAEACATTPAATLSCLSRALLDECRASGLFVSVAYALIDTRDRTAAVASAGHPPGIVLRASGIRERLGKTGPALGLGRDASYGEHRVSLAEGDQLILYTDGLTAIMPTADRGLEAILDDVGSRGLDGGALADRIMRSTDRPEPVDDDVTLLVLTARSGVSAFDAGAVTTRPVPSSDLLAALSASNSAQFQPVVDALRRDAPF